MSLLDDLEPHIDLCRTVVSRPQIPPDATRRPPRLYPLNLPGPLPPRTKELTLRL